MTQDELMDYELVHQKAGNACAMVELIDDNWCRITPKYCNEDSRNRAWLAAMSQLSVFELQGERRKLTEEELAKLAPTREGIANGSLKVVGTHIVPVTKPTEATLV